MKKFLFFLLVLVLSLGLCACAQKEASAPGSTVSSKNTYTFPENTAVLGVDISGLSKEAAWTKLETAVAGYSLNLNVDGVSAAVTAADMDLTCAQDVFAVGAEMIERGMPADFTNLIRFNEGKLRNWMHQHFNRPVTEGAIAYDEAAGQYVSVPHADGQTSNPNALVAGVKESICNLSTQHTLKDVSQIQKPVRFVDDPAVKDALALANKMVSVKLSYVFAPDGDKTTVEIPAETIRSFVTLAEDGFTPVINYSTLDAYVAELSDAHSIEGTSGDFLTSHGSYVGLTVSYDGHYVDSDELAQDIITCMQEGISETRDAPYQSSGDRDMAYGGTYVEIDLSNQHLWYYKNGECLVSASIVSGKVAEGWLTPNGVFSIYDKETSTYLEGADYRAFVNYWMPFYGGYGLHDGTWHSTFGGTIYYYDGSHGCVNMPLSAAATVYNNASVGTKVIIYGGASSCPPLTQYFTGTTSYDVAEDADPFKLNVKPAHSKPTVTYQSSNPSVAAVSSDGTVTIKGIGTATITVTADAHKYYTSATAKVTINVHSACEEGRHKFGDPVTVKEPTCQPGLQKLSCTKCDHTKEEDLKPVQEHNYGDWSITAEATCGKDGSRERTCTTCQTDKQTEAIPATGQHTEGEWVTVLEPTCVDKGSKELKCSVCQTALKTEEIPATGEHTAGDWETVQEATCTENGTKAKYCTTSNCRKLMEEGIIEAGHTPGDWVIVESSTCTQAGSKVLKCGSCETVLETGTLELASHSFSGGPTCDNCAEPNPNYTDPSIEPDPSTEPTAE